MVLALLTVNTVSLRTPKELHIATKDKTTNQHWRTIQFTSTFEWLCLTNKSAAYTTSQTFLNSKIFNVF